MFRNRYKDAKAYFSWLDFHKRLTLLNQQSVLEITGLREESVMEWFISLKKVNYYTELFSRRLQK